MKSFITILATHTSGLIARALTSSSKGLAMSLKHTTLAMHLKTR